MRVGFIGLGNMGEGMATNLVRKGFEVTVRDVREPVERLVAEGAVAGHQPRWHNAPISSIAVFDEQRNCDTCGPDGDDAGDVLAGLAPGRTVAVHATISRRSCVTWRPGQPSGHHRAGRRHERWGRRRLHEGR